MDESTDISMTKTMAVVVRMNKNDNTCLVSDQFLSLMEVGDGTAMGL